jgi:hypothetical protein
VLWVCVEELYRESTRYIKGKIVKVGLDPRDSCHRMFIARPPRIFLTSTVISARDRAFPQQASRSDEEQVSFECLCVRTGGKETYVERLRREEYNLIELRKVGEDPYTLLVDLDGMLVASSWDVSDRHHNLRAVSESISANPRMADMRRRQRVRQQLVKCRLVEVLPPRFCQHKATRPKKPPNSRPSTRSRCS